MSTVASSIDAKAYLNAWLEVVTGMTVADLNHIPDDQWTACHGGCARPANSLMADTVTMLRWMVDTLEGNESTAYHQMEALTAEYADKSAAIAGLQAASASFGQALMAASDEKLNSTVAAPWDMPTPVFMLAQIAVSHIWYHDGQLNYIQALLGDGKVHWMGD